jgi:hypothetical protein
MIFYAGKSVLILERGTNLWFQGCPSLCVPHFRRSVPGIKVNPICHIHQHLQVLPMNNCWLKRRTGYELYKLWLFLEFVFISKQIRDSGTDHIQIPVYSKCSHFIIVKVNSV